MSKRPNSKKIAKEDTKVALQKATDAKVQKPELNTGVTMTQQTADPVYINPDKLGMQSQSINN